MMLRWCVLIGLCWFWMMVGGFFFHPALQAQTNDRAGAYADVNGLRMYYEVHGAGAPLLLLNGGTGWVELLSPLLPLLAAEYQVIVPEQIGHGRTADADRPYSYESMADDMDALLTVLNIESVHVVGWSDGGNTGVALALRHPERVRSLVVTGANVGASGIAEASRREFETMSPEDFPSRDAYIRLSPDGAGHWPVVVNKLIRMWLTDPTFTLSDLASVRQPTLVLIGDRDGVIPLEHTVDLFQSIPGAQLSVIRDADHSVPVTHPVEFADIVTSFIDEAAERIP